MQNFYRDEFANVIVRPRTIKHITQNSRILLRKLAIWGSKIQNRGTEMLINFLPTEYVFKQC